MFARNTPFACALQPRACPSSAFWPARPGLSVSRVKPDIEAVAVKDAAAAATTAAVPGMLCLVIGRSYLQGKLPFHQRKGGNFATKMPSLQMIARKYERERSPGMIRIEGIDKVVQEARLAATAIHPAAW